MMSFNRHNLPSGDVEEPKFVVSTENKDWQDTSDYSVLL